MGKKILILLATLACIYMPQSTYADCVLEEGGSISQALSDCSESITNKIDIEWEGELDAYNLSNRDGGARQKIVSFTKNGLLLIAGIAAIGAIVYGGLILSTANGQEERLKTGKQAIIWAIIGFLLAILASTITGIVINAIYSIGEVAS